MASSVVALSTVGLGASFATFGIVQIVVWTGLGSATYRLWAVVGIFAVLGTVVTPILNRALAES